MNLSASENFLEAVRFGSPQYVPRGEEDIFTGIELPNNKRNESWQDEFGVGWEVAAAETAPFPKHNPLADLTRLDDFKFPNPDEQFDEAAEMRAQIRRAKAQGKLVTGGMSYFLYERAWALMGMENLMIAMVEDVERVKVLLHKIAGYSRQIFVNYLELGVDFVSFSEDLGSQRALMFSPDFFRAHFVPEYAYAFAPVLDAGKMINFHSCGCITDIVDDLAGLGVTVLNPIQARGNDLPLIKRRTQNRMALMGGVDSDLLLRGTPGDVRRETERVLSILKPGGGYILTPDQHFPDYNPENIEAMYQTARALGRYT